MSSSRSRRSLHERPVRTVINAGRVVPDFPVDRRAREPHVERNRVVVRGEGDVTFREILRAIDSNTGAGYGEIAGLAYRYGSSFVDTPPRPVGALDTDVVRLPDRSARVLPGYTLLGRPVDVVETSRGCTYDCSFCSIIEMRAARLARSGGRDHRIR